MSGPDFRDEAAAIARGLKRRLERERASGTGELLARAARAPRKTATPAVREPGPAPYAREPAAAPASAAKVVAAPVADEVDLFGNPVPGSAARRIEAELEAAPALTPAHPLDPAERERIAAAAEPILARIAEEVNACKKCALWEGRNRAVPGVGSALSGIVFIGEAPGADEDRLGEPFVGRAGQLLDKIIQAMDEQRLIPGVRLTRATVFIGNILHCRPPENRVPLPHEIEMSSPYLHRQIEALKPRVICCLGKTAAEHLLGQKASLGAMRGRIHRFHGAKLIVTYHPAACLRNPEYKRPVWEDMQLLAREYQTD